MRQHAQAEGGAGGIPHPVIVGCQHPETIIAGGQVGVKGGPPVAGVDPVVVKALQLIPVLHFLRGHKAQPCVLELDPVSAGLDSQLLRQRTSVVVHQDLLDRYRRGHAVFRHVRGIDETYPVQGGEP